MSLRLNDALTLALALVLTGAVQAQGTHVVRPGETLWDISRQHMNTPLRWPELQRDNAVPVPEKLQPGQVLQLGGAVAAVRELVGMAWLKRGNDAPRALPVGTAVQADDVLITDRGAFLSLELADRSRVVVPSSSALQVLVANGRVTRLELLSGRVEAHVEKQNGREFEIRNRTSGLGVRGTHFRARDEDGVTAAEVIEGAVAVSSNGQPALVLAAASGTRLDGADALKAQPLLPPPQRAPDTSGAEVAAVPIAGARSYRLQLARDERFLQIVHEARSAQGRFTLPNELDAGFYHLRLTALDPQQIEGMPGDSTVYVPDGMPRSSVQRMSDGRYEIRWPARAGQRYAFELARTPAFAPPLVSEPVVFGGGVVVGPLDTPGPYHWRSRELATGADAPGGVQEGSFEVPAPAPRSP